jgi:hypothetical protein
MYILPGNRMYGHILPDILKWVQRTRFFKIKQTDTGLLRHDHFIKKWSCCHEYVYRVS